MKIMQYGDRWPNGPVSLGIDPSLTAFAITAYNEKSQFTGVYSSQEKGVARLHELANTLSSFVAQQDEIIDVALEGTVRNSPSASVLGELTGVVKYVLYDRFSLVPLMVPPMSLKKYASGHAKVTTKSQILLSVYKKWGVEFNDDNAADAYVLARIAYKQPTNKYEEEVLAKLDDLKFRL